MNNTGTRPFHLRLSWPWQPMRFRGPFLFDISSRLHKAPVGVQHLGNLSKVLHIPPVGVPEAELGVAAERSIIATCPCKVPA